MNAESSWTKRPNLSSWVKPSKVLSFRVKAVKRKALTKPLATGIYTMPELWSGLHKLRKSTHWKRFHIKQTQDQVQQTTGWSKSVMETQISNKMRTGDAVSTGNWHPTHSVSPGAGFPVPALPQEWLSQLFWASYITSEFLFSLLNMRLLLLCLCSAAGTIVTVCNTLQRASSEWDLPRKGEV